MGSLQAPTNEKKSIDTDTTKFKKRKRRRPMGLLQVPRKPRQIPETTSPSSMTCVSPRESHWRGPEDLATA
ncbi:hypothetical protein EV363DRAFT_1161101 [Boletus edulis]|nr:hypothetical protein EV363DRAFT_1161101 [Boletus edulis]